MRFFASLEKKTAWFLLIVLFFFFLLRFPSLFEPYWYGDEGIYQTLGMAIKDDRLLYRDIWDNKPPFIYLLYSVLSSDQFATKLASLTSGLLSILVFFFLAKKLFSPSRAGSRIHFFATAIFAILLGFPLIEGNIANAENFMLLPILIAAFLIFKVNQSQINAKIKNKLSFLNFQFSTLNFQLFTTGLLLSFAFLFKAVAFFDLLAFIIFVTIIHLRRHSGSSTALSPSVLSSGHRLRGRSDSRRSKDSLPKGLSRISFHAKRFWMLRRSLITRMTFPKGSEMILNQIIPMLLGFIIPVILTTLFFLINNALVDFLQATFVQNVDYVSYGNKFLIPSGLLFLKAVLLSLFILYIFKIRKILSVTTIFIVVWFAFSLFNAFFAERPYPHYLLVLLPSFSLIAALIVWDKKYQKIITLFALIAMVFIFNNFHFFSRSIAYYENFISFILEKKSSTSYRAFFDKKTPIDYEIALFLKPKINKDSIFIWGDNPQVYKMVGALPPGRYVASYHIKGYKDGILNTNNAINKAKPKFIVIMPDQHTVPFSLSGYLPRIKIDNALVYERVL